MTSIDRKRLNAIKNGIAKLDNLGLSLDEWLRVASNVDPLVSDALEGIYCGEDGQIHEQLGDTRYWIVMGWHKMGDGGRVKVEYCYVS
jgi:hypothetical protein